MAHTAKSIEGTIYEILATNLAAFGVTIIDAYAADPVMPTPLYAVGPAGAMIARIQFDTTEFYRVNSSAALTAIQLVHYHIDVWGKPTEGIGREDNDGLIVARIWQLVTSNVAEAANMGDVGWNNILAWKITYVEPPDYSDERKFVRRRFYCIATWN